MHAEKFEYILKINNLNFDEIKGKVRFLINLYFEVLESNWMKEYIHFDTIDEQRRVKNRNEVQKKHYVFYRQG